jgi:hypothetical protein
MGHGVIPDSTWTAIKEFGLLAVFVAMVIVILWWVVQSIANNRRSKDDLNKLLATIIAAQNTYTAESEKRIDLLNNEIKLLTDAIFKVDSERKVSISEVNAGIKAAQEMVKATTEALLVFREKTIQVWENSIEKMGAARGQIVTAINEHTTTQSALANGAILGVQGELTRQHGGQDAGVKALMEESEKRINEHTDQKVDHNGDTTRNLIIEQLKSINERLDAMQQKAEQRDSQMAKQLHQLSTDLSSTLLLITAPKPVIDLKTDAGTPLPVDVPKEELK